MNFPFSGFSRMRARCDRRSWLARLHGGFDAALLFVFGEAVAQYVPGSMNDWIRRVRSPEQTLGCDRRIPYVCSCI